MGRSEDLLLHVLLHILRLLQVQSGLASTGRWNHILYVFKGVFLDMCFFLLINPLFYYRLRHSRISTNKIAVYNEKEKNYLFLTPCTVPGTVSARLPPGVVDDHSHQPHHKQAQKDAARHVLIWRSGKKL